MRWNFRRRQRIDQDVVTTDHRLGELSIFSSESLADLIDRYPRTAIAVETGSDFRDDRRVGTIGSADGKKILAMVRSGKLSVVLQDLGVHSRPFRRILIRLNQEMMECSESMRIRSFNGDLHLTSPGAESPLRCDTDPSVRWQISGRQTIINYPSDVMDSHQQVQRVLQSDRDAAYRQPLVYEPSMDRATWRSTIESGSMQSIQQAAPHRVIQGDHLGVTLITRYQTQHSIQNDDLLLANHWLRRYQTWALSGQSDGHRFAKRTIAAFVRRKARQQPATRDDLSFSLDPCAQEFLGTDDEHSSTATQHEQSVPLEISSSSHELTQSPST
jgi:hypothetical protein